MTGCNRAVAFAGDSPVDTDFRALHLRAPLA